MHPVPRHSGCRVSHKRREATHILAGNEGSKTRRAPCPGAVTGYHHGTTSTATDIKGMEGRQGQSPSRHSRLPLGSAASCQAGQIK